ncbi:MAG: diaminobutyrate--2-oxoglutarate transaminase family protein, partial [Bacteroidota bacterium]
SDGIEAAIKLVKTATGRRGIFTFKGGYHGMSHGALAMTGAKSPKRAIHNLMKDVTFLPFPYHYRCPFGVGGAKAEEISLHYIENLLRDTHSGVNLPAAFILEVVQGEGGSIPASNEWIRGIRKITARYEIPLIIDEVQAGIGRTGTMFAFEASGIIPDVVVSSKAVGGSLPLSIVMYRDYLDQWGPGAHAGTFRGNQMAMATGMAVIQYIQDHQLVDNAAQVGNYLMTKLRKLQEKYPVIGEVRGRGLMIGVEIVDTTAKPNALGSYPTNGSLASRIQRECFREGLIVETGGRADCVLRLLPPLTLTAEQAKTIVDIFDLTIARALKP